jgi:hypothetical protein
MEAVNGSLTVKPPESPEHIYPVVSFEVPIPPAAVDVLLDLARSREMPKLFWISSERRNIKCELHQDSQTEVKSLIDGLCSLGDAQIFLSTYYRTLEHFHQTYRIPAHQEGKELMLPCRITCSDKKSKLYNFASRVEGYPGVLGISSFSSQLEFRFYCSWCFNRREVEPLKLRKCGRCKEKRYCDTWCQEQHWHAGHKQQCKSCE